ncbi:MAG: type III-B CRISPR module RAMP protein Cmr4 [Faecalibacterium sp.]|nr:type III-B CRISPR module RAMP protein Cmr4 [Ruminococcus sp.]MCM1392537.1 type III-B CRISPR module RAMP protein Cmr4 [Ruminococcus sp.]MCM1486425.1 type III-B CRISPR module RAMP protein Cmr4 [Faecalibacterium sp.]
MNKKLFKITCLTNLHVGSGDVNFDIVDNEVEKDPVTKYPMVHGSGIKGALLADDSICDEKSRSYVFGAKGNNSTPSEAGAYKFMDAKFLARPLRVGGNSTLAYIPVTTVAAINDFLWTAKEFGFDLGLGADKIKDVEFGDKMFVSNSDKCEDIEGEPVGAYKGNETEKAILSFLLGDKYAIVKSFDDYRLPIVARNNIGENLWYEEYVPHKSTFWTVILHPDNEFKLNFDKVAQLGGNASVGCGFVKFDEITKDNK